MPRGRRGGRKRRRGTIDYRGRYKELLKDREDLQNAYNVACGEIARLRKKLGYDKL